MRLSLSTCAKAVIGAAALALIAVVAVGDAEASNMGFKNNRVICADTPGFNSGRNLVSLPYRNPYANAQDVCLALGLTAASGSVQQVRAENGQTVNHVCGDAGAFQFQEPPGAVGQGLKRNGIIVFNPTQVNGILVGSHAGNPPGGITLHQRGATAACPTGAVTCGDNYFPVPYHTTAANAQHICDDLGIAPDVTSTIQRINACTGAQLVHSCGDVGAFALVLGESLLIEFNSPPNPSPVVAPPGHPAHF